MLPAWEERKKLSGARLVWKEAHWPDTRLSSSYTGVEVAGLSVRGSTVGSSTSGGSSLESVAF